MNNEELDPRIEMSADNLFGQADHEEEVQDNLEVSSEEQQPEPVEATLPLVAGETEKAKKFGYLTEDEYKAKHGSLDGFKSPEQFNKYGEAWNEVSTVIKDMQKKLSDRDKAIESLVKYNERVEERAAQRARQELEEQLRQAKTSGDVQAVEELTKEKAKLDFHTYQAVAQQAEQERQQVYHTFVERNKHWYGINPEMTNRAAAIETEEMQKAPANGITLNYQQLAQIVEARLRVEYPDVMIARAPIETRSPSLSVNNSNVNKAANQTTRDMSDKYFTKLNQDQQTIYEIQNRALIRMGKQPYTKKEYIERLKKQGEI